MTSRTAAGMVMAVYGVIHLVYVAPRMTENLRMFFHERMRPLSSSYLRFYSVAQRLGGIMVVLAGIALLAASVG